MNYFRQIVSLVFKMGAAGASLLLLGAGFANAAQPQPWQLNFQEASTDIMSRITWFGNYTLIIITLVTLFVLALLIVVCMRFSEKANPNPSKVSHNTTLEIVWTVVPILIIVAIAIPSFRLLYDEMNIPEADVTVKVVGYQWYWGYEYPDLEIEEYTAIMLQTQEERQQRADVMGEDLSEYPRLLAVDYDMVVPVNKVVKVQVTAGDVIHAFALPAFGVKIDAMPGRLNETWFKAERTGLYYGQCSELCGKDHAYMPIAIRVVTDEQFAAWSEAAVSDIDEANVILAGLLDDETKVAANTTD